MTESTAWFLAPKGIDVVVCEKGHVAGEQSQLGDSRYAGPAVSPVCTARPMAYTQAVVGYGLRGL